MGCGPGAGTHSCSSAPPTVDCCSGNSRAGCFVRLRGQVALCFLAQGIAKANSVKGAFQSRIHLNGQSGLLHSWSNQLWPRTMGDVSIHRAAMGAYILGLCAGHQNLTEK